MKALPILLALFIPAAAVAGCKGCNNSSSTADDASVIDAGADAFTFDAAAVKALMNPEAGAPHVTPWAAIPGATATLLPNMGIGERFQIEAKSRPANIAPNVESVEAALTKGGFHLAVVRQHLGQPFGARYCVGAEAWTAEDAGGARLFFASFCEFMSPDVAVLSRDYTGPLVAMVQDRSVHAHKQMTLTIRLDTKTPENQAAADKAYALFDKL